MKKILFVLTSAALVFTACQKEENVANNGEGMFLTATVEQQVEGTDTKSSLSGTNVSWTSGDLIKVFDAAGKYDQLSAQASGASVSFKETANKETGFSESGIHYAIYPFSAATGFTTGGTITFNIPATQYYENGSFGQDANIAVAYMAADAKSVTFQNVCGVFKLSIFGNFTVNKIVLTGSTDEKICGSFKTTVSSSDPTCVADGTDGTTITLDCSATTVTLSPTNATTFYFVVPVGAFQSGFTAKVYQTGDDTQYTELSTTSANAIVRSRVKAMPESTILPPAYQKVEYIQNTVGINSSYINTGINPIGTGVVKMKFNIDEYVGSYACLFGTYDANTRNFGIVLQNTGLTHFMDGNQHAVSATWNTETDYEIEYSASGKSLTVNGGDPTYFSVSGFSGASNLSIYLFTDNAVNGMEKYDKYYILKGKIYYFQYYEGTELENYLIPAKRKSDNVIGMCDIVNSNNFLTNQGSGNFSAGSAVTH